MNETTDLIINGEPAESQLISQMVRAFFNPDMLRPCGGYIVTYREHNGTAYLGVKPSILNGQRSNHYDLRAGPDSRLSLIGGIDARGEISLLFKIPRSGLSVETKSELRALYARFADLLIQYEYGGAGILDWTTRKILRESELFSSVPSTIFDLRAH